MIINVTANTVIIVTSEIKIKAVGTPGNITAKRRIRSVPEIYTIVPALKKFLRLPEKSGFFENRR
jgi:hypothetical protein